MVAGIIAYCGLPPLPGLLWSRWNLDPVLLLVLLAIGSAYAFRASRFTGVLSSRRQAAFYAGWLVAALALVSPLCALSVSLFAARVGQHMILALIAAPLVAAGRPVAVLAGLWSDRFGVNRRSSEKPAWSAAPIAASGVFAVLLWFWHAPVPYDATFSSSTVYWAMHLSMFAASVWLWDELEDSRPARVIVAMGAGVLSSVQMGLLGALITFAPRALYAPHALTTAVWHLTPLQDQQLGGAIMWVPGCVAFLAVAMAMSFRAFAGSPPSPRYLADLPGGVAQ
jgi:putative membrane protein